MSSYFKIASSTPEGKLNATTYLFDVLDWDYRLSLLGKTTGKEYYELKLIYAKHCQQHADDEAAMDIYTGILDKTVVNGKPLPQYADIAYQAYCGLSNVTFNGSEYIWESGVGLVDMYRNIFEKEV